MREVTQTRVRFGYRRVHVMLRREGCQAGKKLVYRLYREEDLQLRSTRRRGDQAGHVQAHSGARRDGRPGADDDEGNIDIWEALTST
jgi:transposase InsO family protein